MQATVDPRQIRQVNEILKHASAVPDPSMKREEFECVCEFFTITSAFPSVMYPVYCECLLDAQYADFVPSRRCAWLPSMWVNETERPPASAFVANKNKAAEKKLVRKDDNGAWIDPWGVQQIPTEPPVESKRKPKANEAPVFNLATVIAKSREQQAEGESKHMAVFEENQKAKRREAQRKYREKKKKEDKVGEQSLQNS